jgi:hypothetical protein
MTTESNHDRGLTRRAFAGLGIAAGAVAVTGFPEVPVVAGGTSVTPMGDVPDAYGAINPMLTYIQIDALAFNTYEYGESRYFVESTGVQSLNSGHYLAAPIPIPCGSTIYQANVSYRSQPIVEIRLRDHITPTPYATPFQQNPPNSAGAAQVTYDISPGITVGNRKSALFAFYSSGGSALYGVTIGYTPPTQGFVPFAGATPRVLDTRAAGGPLQPGEERVIDLGLVGPRGAVLNLTVTNTGAGGGYVAVFPANIGWPGNSSINWTYANENVANGVTTALDASGHIRIRGGAAPTDVVIDRIGWLL